MSLLQWLLSSEVKARERLRRLQQEELAKQGAHEPGPQASADHEAGCTESWVSGVCACGGGAYRQ